MIRSALVLAVALALVAAGAAAPAPRVTRGAAARQTPLCQELDMPARKQWLNYDGYCGEASLQMAALYYGAWISQYAAREAGGGAQDGGQLLLPLSNSTQANPNVDNIGRNLLLAAGALKFQTQWFPPSTKGAQAQAMLDWTKQQLLASHPVIWGVFISDCSYQAGECWDNYDHIVPVTGYCTSGSSLDSPAGVQDTDDLQIAGLMTRTAAWRTASTLPGAPRGPGGEGCAYSAARGGCLPEGTDYGVAVLGVRDDNNTSLAVRLAVNKKAEPNVSLGRRASYLKGTVTVLGLNNGQRYRLLRYNSVGKVPVSGGAAAFLNSGADSYVDFTATGATWTYKDPVKIASDGVAYYRCVPVA